MTKTSTGTLRWRVTYGAYRARGRALNYLVTKTHIGWAALYRPNTMPPDAPYAMLPFGNRSTRRDAQRYAESHEGQQ